MDKSCDQDSSPINPKNIDSSTSTTTTTTSSTSNTNTNLNNKDHYLKHVHKMSHKITKIPSFKFDHSSLNHHQIQSQPLILDSDTSSQPSSFMNNQQPPQQPPVYNVSKSDFRDVVQKLTGSPAHERVSPHAPSAAAREIHAPPLVKPQSSRLQRIRPPPLEHVGNRPPGGSPGGASVGFFSGQRMLSPLPPLPAVHATAESPISAYMRCFQTSITGLSHAPPFPLPDFHAPPSPLGFGCLPSPGFPFSPTRFQTPLSPTPPAASPRWKSL
ncbi:VQ-like protein [Artemisia annua]|uniref:VQ-like protein n=1 Tax=Artemisia annua TaxID=35608 RepID=A0A2U1N334_ARTAN|nr:VQ-like protein [Artemisia annua]